jgi:hypothetical protein
VCDCRSLWAEVRANCIRANWCVFWEVGSRLSLAALLWYEALKLLQVHETFLPRELVCVVQKYKY